MSNEPLDLEHFDLDTAWLIGTTLATNLVTRAVRTLGRGRADPGTRQHDRSAGRVRS